MNALASSAVVTALAVAPLMPSAAEARPAVLIAG
jgi:hypothetical protein